MAVALYPGSFDPIHNGHMAIIAVAASLFDEIVVAVGHNPAKEVGFFSGPERAELVKACIAGADLANVRVALFTGLVTAAAVDEGADCLIKGVRSGSDLDSELLQANMNHQTSNGLPTLFLPGIGASALISSRYIREIALRGGDVRAVVPEVVHHRIVNRSIAGKHDG